MELRDFLFKYKIKQSDLTDLIGISPGHCSELVNGNTMPSLELAIDIERATAGQVTPYDWGCVSTVAALRTYEYQPPSDMDTALVMACDFALQAETGLSLDTLGWEEQEQCDCIVSELTLDALGFNFETDIVPKFFGAGRGKELLNKLWLEKVRRYGYSAEYEDSPRTARSRLRDAGRRVGA